MSNVSKENPPLWGAPTFASLVITVGVLAVMAYWVDFRAVAKELAAVDWRLAGLAMLAHYVTYPVRGYRWKHCLGSRASSAGSGKFGLIVFFYNFVDNLVPAKLGDVYAAHMVRINFGIGRSPALGSLVFLRMVDTWLVLALAAFASWILFSSHFPASVAWGLAGGIVLAIIVSAVLLAFVFLKHALPDWVPERGRQMVEGFHGAMLPHRRDAAAVAASTVLVWSLEALWIYLLLRSFGIEPGMTETVFLTMLPLLASGFPLTPAGAGVVELTLFGCLHVLGIPGPLAASITVLNRFFDYWLHILLGAATWGIRRHIGLRTWREAPVETSPLVKTPGLST